MTTEKANELILHLKERIPADKIAALRNALVAAPEDCYDKIATVSLKDQYLTLAFSFFGGGIGLDRFYLGDTALGVCKLLFGWMTFGIWPALDIYFSYKRCKELNLKKIVELLRK